MWIPIVISVLVSYLLGNLNGAVLMSNLIAKEDVRNSGSGNAGLTNFVRNYGAVNGLAVYVIDCGKAALACVAGGLMLAPYDMFVEGMAIAGLAVVIGHDFPALLGFRGGKGILSSGAIALVLDWRIGLIVMTLFLVVYLLTQYVSLAAVTCSVTYAVLFVVFQHDNPIVMICGVLIGLLAVFMHRGNIVRLVQGKERKTNLFGKGKQK